MKGTGMRTILLLEDDLLLYELYAAYLERAGYAVVGAHNSREIVALVRTHQPALIVTDLIMPDHEGLEGIFQVRKMSATPLIAISTNPAFLKMASSLVSAILLKPFSGDELRLLVDHVLDEAGTVH